MQPRALTAFVLSALASLAAASPAGSQTSTAKRSTCTVSSVASAASLSSCSSVVIEAFTVPAGNVLTIAAAKGATITMAGSVTFAKTTSAGPLITLDTDDVTFNGAGFEFNGNGADYWDGLGTNSGVAKPHPFLKVKGYGTFSDFTVKDSPAQAISVGTSGGSAVFSSVTVDNKDGDSGNLGHNTDGFDVSASSVTIKNSNVYNQDDCIAINSGSTVVFENNYCSGGHGISIGSIASGKTVSGVTISGNTVVNSMYGMRIKVDSDASGGSVSGVTYTGNTISGISKYGFLVSQSYPDDFSTPGTSSTISGVTFSGATTSISVSGSYPRVGVDCGHCTGMWNWSSLKATGGESSDIVLGGATITGGSY